MLLALDTATPLVTVALHDGADIVVELFSELPMKHGEQLAPAHRLRHSNERGSSARTSPRSGSASGRARSPASGSGWSPRAPSGSCSRSRSTACARSTSLAVEAVATGAVSADFAVATDARRKEVYFATYDLDGSRLDGPVVDKPAALATGLPVVGRGGGAVRRARSRTPAGPTRPSAGWLAHAIAEELAELLDPEPLYLRRPDAVVPSAPKPVS